METFEGVLLCLLSQCVMFFIIDNVRGILSKFDNYLAVHEEPERITYVRTHRSAWTVLYMKTFFFLSLN